MMGEEFYASIKLISGEEIFSLVSIDQTDEDSILILQNPVIMKVFQNSGGMYVKIKPWMEIPDDDFYIIRYDKVITITEIKNELTINFYNKYLNDENDHDQLDDHQVKLSNRMGYVSSVEEARKILEKLYKDTKEN